VGREVTLSGRQDFAPGPSGLSAAAPPPQRFFEGDRRRRFLIVSAPFGPFSRDLAQCLRAAGATVRRVVVNAGDFLDWGRRDALVFRGRREEWPAWFAQTLVVQGVTDLITYGDTNFYVSAALTAARHAGLRTHILEQGYYRPDWVTLETEGVNAHTHLPRDPAWYQAHPAAASDSPSEKVGLSTPNAVRYIFLYHFIALWGSPAFPHFRWDYQTPPPLQATAHAIRFLAQRVNNGSDRRDYERAIQASGPKFLVLLQRPGDSQLRKHSRFADMESFIDHVVADFAANGPTDGHLIFRPHPLDPGLSDYRRLIRRRARELGCSGRLHYCDYGKLHEILALMQGVVCVNSSAGLAGVEFQVPTITLGEALYDMPGLTHQGGLATFWSHPEPPDTKLYLAFRNVHMATTQINGGFATRRGRNLAIPVIVRRLLETREAAAEPRRQAKPSSAA
jgi:capsular polysaccharide export protein